MQYPSAPLNINRSKLRHLRAGLRFLIALSLLCRLGPAGAEDTFIPPRLVQDQERQVIWALRDGMIMRYDAQKRTLLDTFNLPDWSYAIRSESCEPDMVLNEKGDLLVSSNVDSPLWRIDGRTLEVERIDLALDSDTDKDLGFTGLFLASPGMLLAISSIHGSLWKIDLSTRSAHKLALAQPVFGACALGLAATAKETPVPAADRTVTLCASTKKAVTAIEITGLQRAEPKPGACVGGGRFHGRPMR